MPGWETSGAKMRRPDDRRRAGGTMRSGRKGWGSRQRPCRWWDGHDVKLQGPSTKVQPWTRWAI